MFNNIDKNLSLKDINVGQINLASSTTLINLKEDEIFDTTTPKTVKIGLS